MWKKIKEIIKRNNLVVSLYVGYKRLLDIMKDYCYLRSKADFCEKRKNRKEKYLIVRRKGAKGNGIFSDWFYFLPSFELAEKTGRIPVVDMEHYENPYTDINRGGQCLALFFYRMRGGEESGISGEKWKGKVHLQEFGYSRSIQNTSE